VQCRAHLHARTGLVPEAAPVKAYHIEGCALALLDQQAPPLLVAPRRARWYVVRHLGWVKTGSVAGEGVIEGALNFVRERCTLHRPHAVLRGGHLPTFGILPGVIAPSYYLIYPPRARPQPLD